MNFSDTLRIAGLFPRDVVADGKWRRCPTEDKPKKRNGAYVLHPDGRGYWRNWATDGELNAWRDDKATHAPVDHARIDRQRRAERAARIVAMRSARAAWERARPLNALHPYLAKKGLQALGCAGLRQLDGLLVVPVVHGQWVVSIQTISPEGDKRFWPGAPVKAGAYVMERKGAALTCVCEGLATGLAVYQSVRSASVVVAFDAGNLLSVVQRLKPSGAVVLCADNDHGTQARRGVNPGIEKARNAAELIGAGVAYPQGIEGTDYADALAEWGQGGAKKVERSILAGVRYVVNTS
jgi:putative DNA primase/helicase